MKRNFKSSTAGRIILPLFSASLCLAGVLSAPAAHAQFGGGPPPPDGPGGQGRPPFGGPPGGPGGMGAPRPSMTADIPMPMLEAGLSLTADQKAQIAPLQRAFRSQRPPMPMGGRGPQDGPPNGRGPQGGGPPMPPPGEGRGDGPPDQGAMRGQMDAMRNAQQQTSRKIEAILTPEQKQALPALLKELDALRGVGLPADLYAQLKLTSDQKTRIATIAQKMQRAMRPDTNGGGQPGDFQAMQQARRQAHDDALAALTPMQQQLVQRQPRNRPPGGPDGGPPPPGDPDGGGRRGGGDGPPPPPPGGGDGPPPDGQPNPPPSVGAF